MTARAPILIAVRIGRGGYDFIVRDDDATRSQERERP
jgi:hypothetical protein